MTGPATTAAGPGATPPAAPAESVGPAAPDRAAAPRHLYVHVPFCARRCSYCDFAIAVRRVTPVADYVEAIRREMALRYPAGAAPWRVETLYLGGGTPSALGGAGVERLMETLRAGATLDPGGEVTLEANPDDVTQESAAAWRAAGITRLSIGAQSFDAAALAWMHRTHSPARTRAAVEAARHAGFTRLSVDLIFALPASLGRSWARDLEAALGLGVDHISLYGLTVEPTTALGRWVARGAVTEAPEEVYEVEYLAAHAALAGAGYEHYEVSNFARPGTMRARHNSAYWSGAPYAALGPGAHAFDGVERRWNAASYVEWRRRVLAGQDPVAGAERLTPDNRVAERVYLELRTLSGTVLREEEQAMVAPWVDAGWARLDGDRLGLTASGWLRLDALAVALANVRSR